MAAEEMAEMVVVVEVDNNSIFSRNMGSYCWSHGHHPVSAKHDSNNCTNKKNGHKDKATTTNCMGGDNFWPWENRVKPSQHNHASYKGKSATR